MKQITLSLSLLVLIFSGNAQKMTAGLALGISNSFTDIGGRHSGAVVDMNIQSTRLAVSALFDYQFKPYYTLESNLNVTTLNGDDKYAKIEGKKIRNVRFNTPLIELAIMNKFNLFELFQVQQDAFVYPTAALGFSIVYFNPKSADDANAQLKPFGTAGQNLANSDLSPYSNFTTAIVYRLGAETKEITSGSLKTFSFGINLSFHQTFTDYLDDTGHDLYADPKAIEAESGEQAAYYSQPGEKHAWHKGGKKNDVLVYFKSL